MFAISEALALAQNPVPEEDLVINILNGLGSDYSEITSAIRVRSSALPLSELQDILLEHEQKLQEAASSVDSTIPTANNTQIIGRTFGSNMGSADRRSTHMADRRGQYGSGRRGRGGSSGQNRSSSNGVVCRFCEIPGHEAKYCRKLQRFLRDNHVLPSTGGGGPAVHTTTTMPSHGDQQWLFDSGASHHVTFDAMTLPNFAAYGGPDEVRLGGGSTHGGGAHARGELP
ncbi:unnamed protein product [Cuscuta epithymum]|uniref:Uncharacterized protein n=1 Tax=Cuscuta epithymum TaxID=186058 RepID=A0AAV0DJZ3_9ASTE|nr:unnamed protein product [Cuscuta epithymum]